MAFIDGQSMLKKTIDWDLARTRAKLVELMVPFDQRGFSGRGAGLLQQGRAGGNETRRDDAEPNRDISSQLRGRGTVQSSKWTFKQRNPAERWFFVVVRQDRVLGYPMRRLLTLAIVNIAPFSSEQAPVTN